MMANSCSPVWSSVIFASHMAIAAGIVSILLQNIFPINFNDIIDFNNFIWYTRILNPIGAIFGSILSGFLAHKFGRKRTILLLGLLFALSLLLFTIFGGSDTKAIFAAQFFGGFATGGLLVVLPLYIVEIAERRNRGRLASIINVSYCLGCILMTYLIVLLGGVHVQLTAPCIICILFVAVSLVLIFVIAPETPQYFVLHNQEGEAKKSLQRLRNTSQVDDEYLEIRDLLPLSNGKAVLHAMTLLVFRALSGTQVALEHAVLLQIWGNVIDDGYAFTRFLLFAPLITSILSIYLMDTIGRRTILAVSTIGTFIAQVIIGFYIGGDLQENYWLIFICIAVLKICYSFGIALLPIIVAAELQTNNKAAMVLGTAASVSWCITLFLAGFYSTIVETLGAEVFWIFPVINIIAVVYYIGVLRETMKKSPKDISNSFKK